MQKKPVQKKKTAAKKKPVTKKLDTSTVPFYKSRSQAYFELNPHLKKKKKPKQRRSYNQLPKE
jgi:hypothetical protein